MAITTTTLEAAISDTKTQTIPVASATGIAAETLLRVDLEIMTVLAVHGLKVTVSRGTHGSKATTHNSGAIVYIHASPTEIAPPVIQYTGSSLTGSAGATATKGYLTILVDGTLRYIPLTDSVT